MKPYRLLAVDDEKIVLDSFAHIVDHSLSGLVELETARSGPEAVRLAAASRPDIVVMDVMMPGMNGIEAMRMIREAEPRALFLVLSAYDEFEYAKDALRLGAFEYLVKPATGERVLAALARAIAVLDERREDRARSLELRERLERLEPAIDHAFVYAALESVEDPGNLECILPSFGAAARGGFFMTFRFGELLDGRKAAVGEGSLQRAVREGCKGLGTCIVGPLMLDRISIFAPAPQAPEDEYAARVSDAKTAGRYRARLREATGRELALGVGSRGLGAEGIGRSYRESVDALEELGSRGILHRADSPERAAGAIDEILALERRLVRETARGRQLAAVAALREFVDRAASLYDGDSRWIAARTLELIALALRASTGAANDAASSPAALAAAEELRACRDLSDCLGTGKRVVERACLAALDARRDRTSLAVRRAKEAMEAGYARDLGLEDIAREVGLSPGHLCRIFRDETGTTMLDWLTALRMEKARRLLSSPRITAKEVAALVGYRDPNYFSRIFKSREGLTVTEYKSAARGEDEGGLTP